MLAQIQEIDGQLEHAVESYNLANVKLGQIQTELKTNARHLVIARSEPEERPDPSVGPPRRTVRQRPRGNVARGAPRGPVDRRPFEQARRRRTGLRPGHAGPGARSKASAPRSSSGGLSSAGESGAGPGRCRARSQRSRSRVSSPNATALLASIKDQIASLEAAERLRQERLAAEARARLTRASLQAQNETVQESDALLLQAPVEEALATAPPARYGGVVGIAMQYLGVPYVWGGASPSGFDCSGFIMYVYARSAFRCPTTRPRSTARAHPSPATQLEAGDLVFFNGLGHAGIYIGGGQFIHAPHTGDVVKISSLYDSWYAATYVGARRRLDPPGGLVQRLAGVELLELIARSAP